MSLDASTRALVKNSARGLAERHLEQFARIESASGSEFPGILLDEVESLSWLASLADAEESPASGDEAELLATIVQELGRTCPALAARLLAHHLCRICVGAAAVPTRSPGLLQPGGWFGVEAALCDERSSPQLCLAGGAAAAVIHGSVRFVVGGDTSRGWLCKVRLEDDQRGLVLIERVAASSTSPVATLGLRGLGATDGTFADVGAEHYRVIATGAEMCSLFERANRFIAPAYVGLLLSLLENTQRIATNHAQTRLQNGTTLLEIPAIRQQLSCVDRAVALARVTGSAYATQTEDAERLLREIRDAAERATDAGMQTLGGGGYIVGHGMERIWRDVRQLGQLFLIDPW